MLQQLFDERLPKHTLETYEARANEAVRVLSRICGIDAEREVTRLEQVREHLGRRIGNATMTPADPVSAMQHHLLTQMPTIVELVLTLARGAPRGFAYLTQGSAAATLVDALTALLKGTLELHLESGGSAETAGQIADVFRAVFPNLATLADFSPLAQALLVGIVPQGDGLELKLYFNTRLETSVPHRQKIMNVLALCGISDVEACGRTYDALYGGASRFTGIGVDLADADGRVKMYVHTPREKTVAFVDDLIARGIASGPAAHAQKLIDATASDAASSDCEVAFALRGSGRTTLKVTSFFGGKTVSHDDGERVLELLRAWEYPVDDLRELFAALDAPGALIQKHPLHGIGVELTDGPMPKVNVYLQPAL